jgi:hypothetical protein
LMLAFGHSYPACQQLWYEAAEFSEHSYKTNAFRCYPPPCTSNNGGGGSSGGSGGSGSGGSGGSGSGSGGGSGPSQPTTVS